MSAQDTAVTAGLTASLRFGGKAITYVRDSTEIDLQAIKGKYPIEALSGETILGTAELTDWIFLAAGIAALTPDTPQRGDYVEWAGLRFDVVSIPGMGCHHYCDPGRTWLRVHTVQTPVEA